jgi:hypothetical protein
MMQKEKTKMIMAAPCCVSLNAGARRVAPPHVLAISSVLIHWLTSIYRDCIGDSILAGDQRWAGTFGVNLDFVARSHCSVEFISFDDMQVCGTIHYKKGPFSLLLFFSQEIAGLQHPSYI